ncbi:hypothetical protein MTO96_032188 [Rhipicephalus appendiculatus]
MDSKVLFLDLTVDRGASVRSSVIVRDSMCVEVYFGETRVVVLDGVSVPAHLQDLRQLGDVLDHVEHLRNRSSNNVQWAHQLLATVITLLEEIYESETKLRLQKVLELPDVDMLCDIPVISANSLRSQFDVTVSDSDIEKKVTRLPAVTYVAGYCAHAALKKLLCQSCKENLVMDDAEIDTAKNVLITSMTRGGLKFPRELVINAVLTTEIVLDKLRSPRFATQFFALPKQKEVLVALVYDILSDNDDLDGCVDGHAPQQVMHYILSAAANTLLNNLCKTANDKLSAKEAKTSNVKVPATKGKRKLETVKS